MERAVAIKKLGKLLGKSMGYRVDPTAPDQEARDAARAALPASIERKKSLSERVEARRMEILQADAEYQQLRSEYERARIGCTALSNIISHYRITVGTSNSMFFTIRAQGDSWEQVIEKLTEKETLR